MYEFLHGIDHCGVDGISPILVLGGAVKEEDFLARDLSEIQGVTICERGLARGVAWPDLCVNKIAEKLPRLRLVNVEFSGWCDIEDFGPQLRAERLRLICPKIRRKSDVRQFSSAVIADLLIPDKFLAELIPESVENLTLTRPKMVSLDLIGVRNNLAELRIQLARNIENLNGVENFPKLVDLFVTDAPNLVRIGENFSKSSVRHLLLAGVKRLVDIKGLIGAKRLSKVSIIYASKEIAIPDSINFELNVEI